MVEQLLGAVRKPAPPGSSTINYVAFAAPHNSVGTEDTSLHMPHTSPVGQYQKNFSVLNHTPGGKKEAQSAPHRTPANSREV